MRVAVASTSVLRSIQQGVANKQQSAVEVTQTYLQQLKSVEGQVNAFLTVNDQEALAQVRSLDCCHCCHPHRWLAGALTTSASPQASDDRHAFQSITSAPC